MKNNILLKRIGILVFCIVIPNIVATLMQITKVRFARVDFESENSSLTTYILITGLLIGILIIGTLIPENHLIAKGDRSSAKLIPIGLVLNMAINAFPVILKVPVSIIMTFTYLINLEFYSILIALIITSIVLLVVKK